MTAADLPLDNQWPRMAAHLNDLSNFRHVLDGESLMIDTRVLDSSYSPTGKSKQPHGLVETMQGTGPFTVFAPTDEAFGKLPHGTVENLLKPENKAKLVAVLTYHVVASKVMAADVKTMKAKTVNGQSLDVKVTDGRIDDEDAKVVKTDVVASNEVIHFIDAVVLPK